MAYKTYTREMLADFTGRPLASFPQGFVTNSAVPQALLLFKIGTCLAAPDDLTPDQQQIVDFAIISMADAIHLSAPYQAAMASPFNSESIGSYSYSRAAQVVSKGLPTGIGWFDLAVQDLSVCDTLDGIPMSMGIDVFGAGYGMPQTGPGVLRFLTPGELALSANFGFDPSGTLLAVPNVPSPIPAPSPSGGTWVEDPPGSGLYKLES